MAVIHDQDLLPNGLKPLNYAQMFYKRTHLLGVYAVVNILLSSDDLHMDKIQDGVQDGYLKIENICYFSK